MNTLTSAPRRLALRAFTLIELMVVILIIALLIGILMPTLAKSREAARTTKCMVNLRSFGIALEGYRRENHDMLPNVLPFQYSVQRATDPAQQATLLNDPALLDTLEKYIDAPLPIHEDPNDTTSAYVPRDPYFCPCDKGPDVGAKFGISYEYWAGSLMVVRELFSADGNAGFSVTRFYEQNGDFPVMGDGQPWHKGPSNSGQNALYFADWHVDWAKFDSALLQRSIQAPAAPPPNP
jgi:prepilin-type N-terminal cleavage/methylation domain-containing protein